MSEWKNVQYKDGKYRTSEGSSEWHEYSTEEKIVGTWIDGEPIYEKTISLGALSYDTDWHYISHGISNIDKVVELYGTAKSNDGLYATMPNTRPGQTSGIMLCANSTDVAYMCNWITGQDWAYATIRYTKTTDTTASPSN